MSTSTTARNVARWRFAIPEVIRWVGLGWSAQVTFVQF